MEFPQYRRYHNAKSYFKIISDEEFYEYKLSFGKIEEYHFKVKILPERNYIQDMLSEYQAHWEKISEQSFYTFLADSK